MSIRCMNCMGEFDEEYEICPHCGYIAGNTKNEAYHLQPTTIIGKRYIVGEVIGYGGFGVTYIGWDAALEQRVAIKEYFPNEFCSRTLGEDRVSPYSGSKYEQFESGKSKFLSESKCLSKLSDVEGIVKIQECFEENNTAYIVMEYLEGRTLKSMIEEKGKIDVDTAIGMIKPILKALDRVHQEGIIHRDIAPDNIFITNDGTLKIIDFGASKFATTKHSKSLSVVLKPGYSPEEQYRAKGEQGTWTDVYAVAATFYKMITGVTPEDAMERNVDDDLKTPSKLGVKIGKNIENSIMNALNVKAEGRTKTVKEFLTDLEAEEVKRVKIKTVKTDLGKFPLWAKIATGTVCAAIVTFVVLLVTGVISFNTKKAGANYLPEGYTRVPNVINMSNDDALMACNSNNIVLQVYGKEYSDSVEADLVLGQQLYGGSIVENNTTLLVLMSAGQRQNIVPDVVGFMETDAVPLIESIDMLCTCTYVESSVKPSAVVSQSIESGTLVDAGTSMELEVSKGMNYDTSVDTIVPNLVGVQFEEAKGVVKDYALYIFRVDSEYSSTVPKGAIISQNPQPDSTVKQGDVVEVIVSLGAESVLVPDVQYMSMTEAQTSLEEAGLKVQVEYQDSDVVMKDFVISQSVAANTFVDKNSTVIIYVSNGNEDAVIEAENIQTNTFVTQETQEIYEQTVQVNQTVQQEQPSGNNSSGGDDAVDGELVYQPVEEVKMVTMPNLTGMSEADALSALSSQGLIGSVSYSHNENSTTGTVLSQNISSGTEVAKGSCVILGVCNNETKTQYRYRSISEETTTSSSSTLAGWTLYNTSTSWSDYGSWSGWSTSSVASSDSVKVESRKEYRYRDKETTSSSSSSMSGWTQTGSAVTSYTAWGSNQTTTTKPTESNTLRITNTTSKTTYNYFHYCNQYKDGSYGIDSVKSGGTIKTNLGYHTCTTTSPLPKFSLADIGGKQPYGGQGSGAPACKYNFYVYFSNGSTTTYTYTYQTRSPIYTYYYSRWKDWSGWGTTAYTQSDTRQVETRTVYRYASRSLITTYHYKRNVYGSWSDWSDTPSVASDVLDVETKEVYVY
ncbi:MAG: PASTA domain-containing protein [Lachnospiraceae bacterium]|nr:PASTA domain-containing protein [Lachnospiraceae bacterium]